MALCQSEWVNLLNIDYRTTLNDEKKENI